MQHAAPNWLEVAETGRQMRRFLVVGILCVLVDLGTYYALAELLGGGANRSKAISYLAGVIFGFALNKWWTFQSVRKTWAEPVSYLMLYALTLIVNVACNRFALESLGEGGRLIAYLFATGVTTILNFFGMRLVTFRRGISDRRSTADQPPDKAISLRKAG